MDTYSGEPSLKEGLGSDLTKEQEMLLKNAFGESSDSDDELKKQQPNYCEHQSCQIVDRFQSIFCESPTWERIIEIRGLSLCRNFLTSEQQSSLLMAISKEGWFTEASHNQAMRFGDLPRWATVLSESIREVVHFNDYASESNGALTSAGETEACIFPSELLWRMPLFDQLIVNVYQAGEGICAHVDLLRFDDGIAIVSLESSCMMHFSRVETLVSDIHEQTEKDALLAKVPVHLNPGSLVVMCGEARYRWKHEINRKPGFQKWENRDIDQKRRTSITLRKLCRTE